MPRLHRVPAFWFALLIAAAIVSGAAQPSSARKRNVLLFITDGMRPGSITEADAPTLWRVRAEGVNFVNSHSVFPTLTMPNAAAIATGHYPGDTGQFANNLFFGFPIFKSGNFGRMPGSLAPSVEDDLVLGDLDSQFGGNYVSEESLLGAASRQGFATAAIGKLGPTAMQSLAELAPENGRFRTPNTIILDASTGTPNGLPLSAEMRDWLRAAGMSAAPPARNQPGGNNTVPGALTPNTAHQQWLVDAVTKAILPHFIESARPFVVTFWSGDPDQTQHAQGDSLNKLSPGINGPTSRAAVRNADNNLKQLLDFLSAHPEAGANTDVFLSTDHGFSTVSRRQIDAEGHQTKSYSSQFVYRDASGRQEVNDGALPNGSLAIDLAHALNMPLFDPDTRTPNGQSSYAKVDPTIHQQTASVVQHPSGGSGLIGGTGRADPIDAAIIVVGGGSIQVPSNDKALVQRIVKALAQLDYVGALFVHDRFGTIAGALPLSAINLLGSSKMPAPAVVVSYRHFSLDPANPLMTSVMVGGVFQQEGQGNHGVFARANTFNNMAAIGPDFKTRFVDRAPVGNVDIRATLAKVLGIEVPSGGRLRGRVLAEALKGGPDAVGFARKTLRSKPETGRSTVLMYQQAGGVRYLDEACFTAAPAPCSPATR